MQLYIYIFFFENLKINLISAESVKVQRYSAAHIDKMNNLNYKINSLFFHDLVWYE